MFVYLWVPLKVQKVTCFMILRTRKVFISTNARFLEDDYMIDNKPKSKIILKEMREKDDSDQVPIRPT